MPARNTVSQAYWEAEVIGEDILKKIINTAEPFYKVFKNK